MIYSMHIDGNLNGVKQIFLFRVVFNWILLFIFIWCVSFNYIDKTAQYGIYCIFFILRQRPIPTPGLHNIRVFHKRQNLRIIMAHMGNLGRPVNTS